MPKMIQIRNVPDDLHRKLKVRSSQAGMSLSDYLLHEARRAVDRPRREEIIERLAKLPPVRTRRRPADVVRALRESDDPRRV